MRFSDAPVCHKGEPRIPGCGPLSWEVPRTVGARLETFRTCSYCGSIHPEDLIRVANVTVGLELADMKYGWPHKVYVDGIPNPLAGRIVEVGSSTKNGITEPIMGHASATQRAKFYTQHFEDCADEESRAALNRILSRAGVEFTVHDDGRIGWRFFGQ